MIVDILTTSIIVICLCLLGVSLTLVGWENWKQGKDHETRNVQNSINVPAGATGIVLTCPTRSTVGDVESDCSGERMPTNSEYLSAQVVTFPTKCNQNHNVHWHCYA